MKSGWVHGDYTFCDRPVEVVENKMMRRGLPPKPLGTFRARFKIGEGAYVVTDESFESANLAQRYLLNQLHDLCQLYPRYYT